MFHVKHRFSIFHKYESVLFVIFVIFMLFHSFYSFSFLMFHVKHFLWSHGCSFYVHFVKAIFQFISKYSIIRSKKVRYQHELEKDIIVHLDSNRNNNPGVPRNKQIHIQHLWWTLRRRLVQLLQLEIRKYILSKDRKRLSSSPHPWSESLQFFNGMG